MTWMQQCGDHHTEVLLTQSCAGLMLKIGDIIPPFTAGIRRQILKHAQNLLHTAHFKGLDFVTEINNLG